MTLQEQNNLKFGSRLYFPEIGLPETVEKDGKMFLRTTLYVRQGEFIRMVYKEGYDYLNLEKTRTYKCARVRTYRGDLRWETVEIPLKICFSTASETSERMGKELKKQLDFMAKREEERLKQMKRIKTMRIDV